MRDISALAPAGNQGVFVVASKDNNGNSIYLKMRITDNIQIPSVTEFVSEMIVSGATVETDGFRSYRKSHTAQYTHCAEDFNSDSEYLKWLHRIIGNTKVLFSCYKTSKR